MNWIQLEEEIISDGIAKIGYSVNQIDERTFELVKNDETAPSGDYLNPIRYAPGMTVVTGKFYTDNENIWEAVKDGQPVNFNDREYFDIIE